MYTISLLEGYKDDKQQHDYINTKIGHSHVSTVTENRGNYTTAEFQSGKWGRKLYHVIGAPSPVNYKKIYVEI